jgi:putative ABC transport system permease protein
MRLLWLVGWPYMRRHLLRTSLTVAGIVLGVAVFVAMQTANESVLAGFSETIDRIAGKTDLQITAGDAGFSEDVLETVQSVPGVRVAVPVIEAVVESGLEGEGTLLVLAIDMTGDRSLRDYDLASGDDAVVSDPLVFLAQPDSIIVSSELAARARLGVGGTLPLRTAQGRTPFTVRGVMKPEGLAKAFGGNLAIMDVYAAQKMFGRGRTFDRIDLAVAPGTPVATCQQALQAALGPGFEVQVPAMRGRQAETMLEGYAVMVRLSSAFALFVGLFIIYSAFSIAVTQRRAEIGVLRALGATGAQIRRIFLVESAALGTVGSLIGIGVGALAARATAVVIGSLAGHLYGVAEQASEVSQHPVTLLVAFVAGVATSVAGALFPAASAARVDPVEALERGRHQLISATESRVRFAGAALAAAGAALCMWSAARPVFYAGYLLAIAAAVLVVPFVAGRLVAALRPGLRALLHVEGSLAADSLIQAPRRTSATVLALMLSVAMVVAFGGMASASYGSVVEWLDTTMNPDLFVMPSPRLDLRTTRFPASMGPEMASVPGVARVQMFRNARISLQGRPVMAVALEMRSVAETSRARPVAGRVPEMYEAAAAGRGVILSDTLAERLRATLGDTVTIPAPYGTVALPVAGIIVDYTDQQGAVFMDRSVFVAHWRDDSVSDFRVFVAPGTDVAGVRARILQKYAGTRQIFVLTSAESRAYVLDLAEQWFGLMDVQVGVAVLIAVLGIVNALTVSVIDRRRELGVLQAVGALRVQVRRTIWLEALAVAALGLLLGCALGALNLYFVLDIVQRDVAGLRLGYYYPVSTLLVIGPIILAAAFAASIWPAEAALRTPLVEALTYE